MGFVSVVGGSCTRVATSKDVNIHGSGIKVALWNPSSVCVDAQNVSDLSNAHNLSIQKLDPNSFIRQTDRQIDVSDRKIVSVVAATKPMTACMCSIRIGAGASGEYPE